MENTNREPLISFCMTTYKRPDFLQKQLSLLLTQTYTSFEVVVCDNDTEGSARDVVTGMNDARFRYYCNGANLGMIKSFNNSLQHAKGDYVVMLTDDDPVYPNMLQVLVALSQDHPGYGAYYGSHDTYYSKLLLAKVSKGKVGVNSSLADLEIGTVRQFSAEAFPNAFMKEDFGGGILWSVGMVKRDIALAIGGVPDFGSPFMADCSYVLLAGAQSGMVVINQALGQQVIHGDNFGYAGGNYQSLVNAPEGFVNYTLDKLQPSGNRQQLKEALEEYVGKTLVVYFVFIKKMIVSTKNRNESFEQCMEAIFKLPYMKRWKRKYHIAVHYPGSFQLLVQFKQLLFKRNQ
ncbi:glycosyltransferase family 2 protein [Longitalea arenae]|uniref:glycosyltransferase family 2 protein n=1 Tax=Longitalea arenae TaxID=2812558 RepID=UPI001968A129|nr:glycosyltransferase family A protein [Longitalea arenae]